MFKRVLRGLLLMLLVVGGFVALLASEWLPPTRPEHQAALDFLREPQPPATGRSAFAVLWFLRHDIGEQDPDDLMRRDLAAFDASAPIYEGFRSLAAGLPEHRLMEENICSFPEPCLPKVRELAGAGAALRDAFGDQLRASDRLLAADHYGYPFSHSGPLQVPRMGLIIDLRRFAHAQAFAAGDRAGGIAAACTDLAAWRRLRPTTDLLIHDMIAIAFAQTQAGVLAEMLAEWPADQPLPEACGPALAPLADAERDQCNVWRGEARFTAASIERARGEGIPDAEFPLPGWVVEVFVNRRRLIEFQAYEFASGCNEFPGDLPTELGWMDWTFDFVNAVRRAAGEEAGVASYHERHLDYLDVVQTLRIATWLRSQPDRRAAWSELPATLAPMPAGLSFDAGSETLALDLRRVVRQDATRWEIPLPPALPTRAPPG